MLPKATFKKCCFLGVAQDGGNVAEISIDENDNARGFIQFNVTRNIEGAVEAYELPRTNNSVLVRNCF